MINKQHLHPFALLIKVGFLFRDFLPAVLGFVFLRQYWQIWLILPVVLILWACLDYYCFTYEMTDKELIVNSGVIIKQQRHIPYQQIQNLQRRQWFFLEPFGVETLIVDTGAKEKDQGEVTLLAVSNVVRMLLDFNSSGPTDLTQLPAEPVEEKVKKSTEYEIGFKELALYAMTNPDILGQFLFVLVISDHLGLMDIISNASDTVVDHVNHYGLVAVLIILNVIILGLMVVNLARVLLRLYGFKVIRQDNLLTVKRGLIQKSILHVSINRIQSIHIRQNIFRQIFGLVTVELDLIADATKSDEQKRVTLIPVISQDKAYSVLKEFLDYTPEQAPTIKKCDWYTSWLFVRNALVGVGIVAMAVAIFYHGFWYWIALMPLIILAIIFGWYKGYYTGINRYDDGHLALRTARQLTNDTVLIGWHEIQSMSVDASLLMVWTKRANLIVSVRSGNQVLRLRYRYLPTQEVEDIFKWYREYV